MTYEVEEAVGERDGRVGAAVADYNRRLDSDEKVELLGFLSEHLDVAPELIRYLRATALINDAASTLPGSGGGAATPFPGAGRAFLDGKFKFIRLLGRGGMGEVKLMREDSGREVAVKTMLPSARPNSDRLKRFQNESRIIGKLNHPNIVQVYYAGEDQGIPFIVMEYVEGGTLHHVLSKGAVEFREAAEMTARLADAVQSAHAEGVVHRDLKPANVLLGKSKGKRADALAIRGEEYVLKLTDFGLAWQEVEDNERMTRAEDIVGTPQYMAPEQTTGRMGSVSAATDVYALGAILYECLTGRAPFEGPDKLEVLNEVRQTEPVPPQRLRPKTPIELNTICMKCLEKLPKDRYATAQELADDINRFLNNEPIHARPAGRIERTGKWMRRHPWPAGFIAFALVAALAFAGNEWRAKKLLEHERDQTASERDRALKFLVLAIQSVNDYSTRLSEDPRIKVRDLEDLRKELLARAVGYYDKLTPLNADNPDLREERGKAYGRWGDITAEIGTKADALAHYDRALEAFEQLSREFPDRPEYRRSAARTLNNQASVLRRTDQPELAEAAYKRTIDLHRELVVDPGATARDRQELAGVLGNVGNYHTETGRPDLAAASFRESREIFEALVAQFPTDPELLRDLASAERHIGVACCHTGEIVQAETSLTAAREREEALVRGDPKNEQFKVHLGATLNDLAILYTDIGRPEDAEKAYRRAIQLGEELAAAHPRTLAYRSDLAKALDNLGTLYADLGRYELAEKSFLQARDIRRQLTETDPADLSFQHDLAGSFNNLGLIYSKLGREQEAESSYSEALRLRARVAQGEVRPVDERRGRATALNNQGNYFSSINNPVAAAKAYSEALALLRVLSGEHPNHVEYCQELSKVLSGLGGLAVDRRDWESCLRYYGEALALRRRLATAHPNIVEHQSLLTTVHNNLGRAYHLMSRYEDAAKEYNEAFRINAELAQKSPMVMTWRLRVVQNLLNLGTAFGAARKHEDAEATFKAALAQAASFERDFMQSLDYRETKASILNGLGVVYFRTNRRPLAEQTWREGVVVGEKLHADFPRNVEAAASLGLKYGNMGEATEDRDRPQTALDWHGKAIATLEVARAAQPHSVNAREYLILSYSKRARFLAKLGRHADARRDWEGAIEYAPPPTKWHLQLELATCLGRMKDDRAATALAAELAKRTDLSGANLCDLAMAFSLSSAAAAAAESAERRALAGPYADRALELLLRAEKQGFFRISPRAAERLKAHAAFAPLRGQPEFQALISDSESGKK